MFVPDWLILAIAISTLCVNTVALIVGMNRFKVWLQKAVIEPYIRPIKDDQSAMKAAAETDHTMLIEHDRYIYLLLGKNFSTGGSSVDVGSLIEQISKGTPT